MVLEREYQSRLVRELRKRFPNCVILKNDEQYCQGIPDLLILWNDRWAMLEVKARADAPHRPNQDYYVDLLDEMSFAAFIFPENQERVLDELQRAFTTRRSSRLSEREQVPLGELRRGETPPRLRFLPRSTDR